jgi:hypothetical protein
MILRKWLCAVAVAVVVVSVSKRKDLLERIQLPMIRKNLKIVLAE